MRALALTCVLLSGCDFGAALEAYCANGRTGCDNYCPLDGGPCQLSGAVDSPFFLTAANGFVYFSTAGKTGGLFEVPILGGDTTSLLRTEYPGGVAVDAHQLTWASRIYQEGTLSTYSLDDRSTSSFLMNRDVPCDVAMTATDVYWSENPSDAGNGVFKATRSDGTVTRIGIPTTLTCRITLTQNSIYWADEVEDGTIWEANLDGTNVAKVAEHQVYPTKVVADENNIYWTERGDVGDIKAMVRQTGAISTLADVLTDPVTLATDGVNLYYSEFDDVIGTISKVPVGGGDPIVIADGVDDAYSLVLDDTSVYWVSFTTDGGVYRAAK